MNDAVAAKELEAGMAVLQGQRAMLGDLVVDVAVAALRERLAALNVEAAARDGGVVLRQATVMFLDVVGSTELGRELAVEDVLEVMHGALARFSALVEAHRGRVLRFTGDGLKAVFGAEGAREDDAARAVRAGLAILDEARVHARRLEQRHGITGFAVRVGLNTGPVLLGGGVEGDNTVLGTTVNLAARMEQSAPAGHLRVNDSTARLLDDQFEIEAQPALLVKGHNEPLRTWLVRRQRPRAFRQRRHDPLGLQTPLFGRERELGLLRDTWRQVHAGGPARVIFVQAEAGIGKSRLVHAFEDTLELPPAAIARARAVPDTRLQPFGLLRLLLTALTGGDEGEPAERLLSRFVECFVPWLAADMGNADALAEVQLLGHLVGMGGATDAPAEPAQLRRRALYTARRLLDRWAEQSHPALLLLDDMHWADDPSADLLAQWLSGPVAAGLLVVAMARPELAERRAGWPCAAAERLVLRPLPSDDSRRLAESLLSRLEPAQPALALQLAERAEGHAYFLEELVRALAETGAIETTALPWRWHPERARLHALPTTLTGLLQARLDRLPPPEQLALQQASVIGPLFWDDALAAVDASAPACLARLAQQQLIEAQPAAAMGTAVAYAFTHQLLQSVCYDTVLRDRRRAWHGRVAAWLTASDGERAADRPMVVAEHYERAQQPGRASEYYARAAEYAGARYAHAAAQEASDRGLALAEAPQLRWRLLLVRERVHRVRADADAQRADLQALNALAQADGAAGRRGAVALREALALQSRGELAAAEAAARAAASHFAEAGEASQQADALGIVAGLLRKAGRHAEALVVGRQGLALAEQGTDRRKESDLITGLAAIHTELGEPLVSAVLLERSVAIDRAIGSREGECAALNNLGDCLARIGDFERARDALERGLAISRAIGRTDHESVLLLNLAGVAHQQHDHARACAHAGDAVALAEALKNDEFEAYARQALGQAELGRGRLDAAAAAFSRAAALLEHLQLAHLAVEPIAGLARVAMADGRAGDARIEVERVLAHLGGGGTLDGTEQPLLVLWTCIDVLRALQDARAEPLLAEADALLRARAAPIADDALRQRFLHDIPHHRAIMDAVAAS